jgi:hypothetical protein
MRGVIGIFSKRSWLVGLVLALGMHGAAHAQDTASSNPKVFKICKGQTYALCALASCFVYDKVSYCKCDVKSGDSISLPFKFGDGQDVCTVNAAGATNGYMISTFSPPPQVAAPNGNKALYTCPASSSNGAYAQCDGGVCFKSAQGQTFPGSDKPLAKDEIICSCPITTADPSTAKTGFQIAGPYPCQASFFQYCNSATANSKTGSTIYVGAPTGSAYHLTQVLTGSVPTFNECRMPR